MAFALAGGIKFVQEVKDYRDHLRNPYNYAEKKKIVVIPKDRGLIYAIEQIDGFTDESDFRPVLEYVKDIPENEETLHGGEIVPEGAGIFVPVSMEKNDD